MIGKNNVWLPARPLYLRRTDARGRVTVQAHQVWDVQRFLESQREANEKLKPSDRVVIAVTDLAEYRHVNWRK